MSRPRVIAVVSLLLAFAGGWLVGRAGGSDARPGRFDAPPAAIPIGTTSAGPVTKTPSGQADPSHDTDAVARLRIAPPDPPPPAPPDPRPPETSDASRDAAVTRRELTPAAVDENGGLVRSALFSAARGLAESCYVELREATLARLAPNLGSADQQRAHAAVDAFIEAEYRYRATENTVLLEKFVWRQPSPPTGGSGLFLGKLGSLKAGSIEYEYVLNFDEYPQLAKAHADRSRAQAALTSFLTK